MDGDDDSLDLDELEARVAAEEARLNALRADFKAKQLARASKSARSPLTPPAATHMRAVVQPPPPPAAPIHTITPEEQAAFSAGAAARAEDIAAAEKEYHVAVEAAELLTQQCEDDREMRELELHQLAA